MGKRLIVLRTELVTLKTKNYGITIPHLSGFRGTVGQCVIKPGILKTVNALVFLLEERLIRIFDRLFACRGLSIINSIYCLMRRYFVVLFVALILSFQYGCADFETVTRSELPDRSTELTGELAELYRSVAEASPFVHSLDGYADITIQTPRKRERVYCNIQLARHKESRMIVSAGLLGWPVADLYFGTDSLFVHDMMGNKLLTGRNSEENLEKIIGMPSGYRLLSESMLGLVILDEPVERAAKVRKGHGRVMYTFEGAEMVRDVVIDPENRTLTELLLRNQADGITTRISFRNFQSFSFDGLTTLIPGQIEMELSRNGAQEGKAYRLLIDYDKRTINPEQLSIRFVRPKKARVISLDDIDVLPWM